jgi:endonuclease YncB( thermonuclease family)
MNKIIAFFLAISLPAFSVLAPLAASAQPAITSYDQLVSAIRNVRHETESRIEAAVEQEKVKEAWQTGKLIHEHILLNKDRAEYGKQVITKLAKDLNSSETELKYMVQFARTYPKSRPADELSWSHYQSLLAINDDKEREEVAKRAVAERWDRERVREEVRKRNNSSLSTLPSSLPEIKPGKIGVYRVAGISGKKYVDLGFQTYKLLSATNAETFREGAFIEVKQKGTTYTMHEVRTTIDGLYTYNATVADVYDGDTFYAYVDLGFGTVIKQQLRLRRIDAPELVSKEGKEAKAVLEKILMRNKGRILIKVSKSEDQFGRYLVDIWVEGEPIEKDLIRKGFQARVDE